MSLRGRVDRLEGELRRHTASAPGAAELSDLLAELGERSIEVCDRRRELVRQATGLREAFAVWLEAREDDLEFVESGRKDAWAWARLREQLAEAEWERESVRAEREASVLDAEADLARLEQALRELCRTAVRDGGQSSRTRLGDAENRRDWAERALRLAQERAGELLDQLAADDEDWFESLWEKWYEAVDDARRAEGCAADLQRKVDNLRDELDRLAALLSSLSERRPARRVPRQPRSLKRGPPAVAADTRRKPR